MCSGCPTTCARATIEWLGVDNTVPPAVAFMKHGPHSFILEEARMNASANQCQSYTVSYSQPDLRAPRAAHETLSVDVREYNMQQLGPVPSPQGACFNRGTVLGPKNKHKCKQRDGGISLLDYRIGPLIYTIG